MNWISVNDKLPEEYKGVLIFFIEEDVWHISVGFLAPSGIWFSEKSDWSVNVTHWMPLPEKP